ncbi:YIP1 family protein [Undibacterium flavidum]|uniref:DUF1282 family protein n=1 Tax=Undibacterium flavidum TaxID=2762297 RepID=A0ABR6YCI1_9BURK|nr:YIP1 family protein [Undibacterium flavidum]MBC3874250.1 DUF1282 family protein [Undibacterium flavidum]
MNIFHFAKMPFSFHDGWDLVVEVHPSIMRSFFALVLPFSLIAPASLFYAGSLHSAALGVVVSEARWLELAIVFFVAELITVPIMGAMIKSVADKGGLDMAFEDAFLLAAISAVPMWLSSLGLFLPELWIAIGSAFIGLGLAASVLYHGAYSILRLEDKIEAQLLSYQVFSVGAMVWLILCTYVILMVLT